MEWVDICGLWSTRKDRSSVDQLDLTGPSGSSFWLPNNYGFNSWKDSVSVNLDDKKIQTQCIQFNLTGRSSFGFLLMMGSTHRKWFNSFILKIRRCSIDQPIKPARAFQSCQPWLPSFKWWFQCKELKSMGLGDKKIRRTNRAKAGQLFVNW